MAELLEADPVDRLALRHEAVIARHVARREPPHLGAHAFWSPQQLNREPSSKRMA